MRRKKNTKTPEREKYDRQIYLKYKARCKVILDQTFIEDRFYQY